MVSYFFWDIENVSFHNLPDIMERVRKTEGEVLLYVVFSKIKDARKVQLIEDGWKLIQTTGIAKNSADNKIKEMIDSILEETIPPDKIFLITEDKGFFKISKQIIKNNIQLEIIRGTKDPQWIKDLKTH